MLHNKYIPHWCIEHGWYEGFLSCFCTSGFSSFFSNLLLIISWHFLVVVQHFSNATQCPLVSPWHYLMYPWHPCWPRMSSYYLSCFFLTSPNIFLTLPKVSMSSLNIFPTSPQPLKYIHSWTPISLGKYCFLLWSCKYPMSPSVSPTLPIIPNVP